ncbi:hypothetical protein CLOSTHATH_02930 [Hungatella hathewayi DSM 13479]|uniref:Uncharacterized protein n=1 Tax=Hungatella hathewayi DSM 13479 TaxID=566550 RepID=D3AH43_9FIRM|nr:hypothetical protein CLOSTHATH_02930 [Hungatella hathewayi DSM 13479]
MGIASCCDEMTTSGGIMTLHRNHDSLICRVPLCELHPRNSL